MTFQVGDTVMHWTFGMGKIVGMEERSLSNNKSLFYMVKVRDLIVYVPIDSNTDSRLRPPTPASQFKNLFVILKSPGAALSENRLERKSMLRKALSDGKIETTCQVIRDLSALSQTKGFNDDDKNTLHRAKSMLCVEWGFSLSVSLEQAEAELRHLLAAPQVNPTADIRP